jgi:hypothetical protein
MVGDDGETVAGVMLPVPARVEEAEQLDEVAPHADGGEVDAHANDGVEAPVVSDAALPDAGGDAEAPPNVTVDEVEIRRWRCVTCEFHKPQTAFPNTQSKHGCVAIWRTKNRARNCISCKRSWEAVWRTAKRTSREILTWLLYFKHNFPSSARSMFYACKLHDGYEARAQVMAQYVALHPIPPQGVKARSGKMLASNAHPAAKAKVCDIPLPAVLAAPAAPQLLRHPAEEHRIVRRRHGDRYEVIDVCIVASEHCCVDVACLCDGLICYPLILTLRDQLLMLKCVSLVSARRLRVKTCHIQLASFKR